MTNKSERIYDYVMDRGIHRAGSLARDVLAHIEHMMTKHLDGRALRSAETGCGASTALLSQHGGEHIVYCLDDTSEDNSSVIFARQAPGFNSEGTKFIFGPTQNTLIQTPPKGPFDLVLIDGPHAYPFPEIEYFFFYPQIRTGGVLIIDDIQIPTIKRLFDFISSDDMFLLHSVVRTTAFFIRTGARTFPVDGDDWPRQRFNAQNFPAYPAPNENKALRLPIKLDEASVRQALQPFAKRGFVSFNNDFYTEGDYSILQIPIEGNPDQRPIYIEMKLRAFMPEKRSNISCDITFQFSSTTNVKFNAKEQERIVRFSAPHVGPDLHLRFANSGLKAVRSLVGDIKKGQNPFVLLGVAIKELKITL